MSLSRIAHDNKNNKVKSSKHFEKEHVSSIIYFKDEFNYNYHVNFEILILIYK